MDHVTACSVHLSTLKRKNGPCQSCFPDSIETEKKQAKAAEETAKTPTLRLYARKTVRSQLPISNNKFMVWAPSIISRLLSRESQLIYDVKVDEQYDEPDPVRYEQDLCPVLSLSHINFPHLG